MNRDTSEIFELYLETASEQEQPQLHIKQGGAKEWQLHGMRHRVGAPAIETSSGTRAWYLYNKLHRIDGPAVEWCDGTKSWWLSGIRYVTPEAWAEASLKLRDQPHDDAAVDSFLKTILKKHVDEAL